jgi:pimeloyl-ACP methyl ester carboxylesterase
VGAVIGLLCVFSPSASAAVKHAPPPRPAQQHFRTHAVPGTPGPSAGDSTIAWGPCTEQDLIDLGAQCGYLPVPVNYRHPNGPQIQLAVSRLEHTSSDADYKGVILTNPGGPGGSGLDLSAILAATLTSENYPAAAADYDWIGFDPRGVGASQAISCDPNFEGPDRRDYTPSTFSLLRYWLSRSNAYAKDCVTASPQQTALLNNDTTVDSALDMDAIRRALDAPKISYYGFSYGTYLGQVYSTLFPSHVDRLILDSNVDPRRVWYGANLDQDAAFERNINIWFAWLAKYDSVYHLGATANAVSQQFYASKAALENAPAGSEVGPDEWTDIFLEAGYYQLTWLSLGQLFSEWVNNPDAQSASDLVAAYQATDTPGNDNELADYLAVQCTDTQWPRSLGRVLRDNWRYNSFAPFETWANGWFNGPCNFWRAPASRPVQIDGSQVSSALLIDETLDAATPFTGSLEVRQLFPNAVLLAEPGGTTHADSLFGDACVDSTIATYLTDGTLPPRNNNAPWDKTCAPLPVPDPTATTPTADPAGAAGSAGALVPFPRAASRPPVTLASLGR